MMTSTQVALFAFSAHKNQQYGDQPYSSHLLDVAFEVHRLYAGCGDTDMLDQLLQVVFLHDVLEDTAVTAEQLREEGVDLDVVLAVEWLTKPTGMDYFTYIDRLVAQEESDLAVLIKFADNTCNMRGDKSQMSAERRERLERKYAYSFPRLEQRVEKILEQR